MYRESEKVRAEQTSDREQKQLMACDVLCQSRFCFLSVMHTFPTAFIGARSPSPLSFSLHAPIPLYLSLSPDVPGVSGVGWGQSGRLSRVTDGQTDCLASVSWHWLELLFRFPHQCAIKPGNWNIEMLRNLSDCGKKKLLHSHKVVFEMFW